MQIDVFRALRYPYHMTAQAIQKELARLARPERRAQVETFFKTGPGDYAEGDRFIGVYVPDIRKTVAQHAQLADSETRILLTSPVNEERLAALLVLVGQYRTGDAARKKEIYGFYLDHTAYINNWNLVDASAHEIVGAQLSGRDKAPLRKLAKSQDMWERRIGMVATWHDIRKGDCDAAFEIADMLVNDDHDLIHKSTGWMLREAGKQDMDALEGFLDRHAATMPRTMLRYAIERFTPERRRHYMTMKDRV